MDKAYFEKINKEISDYFGDSVFRVEKDKRKKNPCDLFLVEAWMYGKADKPEPEDRRTAVAAYIYHEHPEVQTIAYGGAMYTRKSILVALYWKFGR